MQATGIDGWAHTTFNHVTDETHQWIVEHDRFVILTANVGENLSGLRVADEKR